MAKDIEERIDEILEPLKLLGVMPGYGATIKKQINQLITEAKIEGQIMAHTEWLNQTYREGRLNKLDARKLAERFIEALKQEGQNGR